MAEIVLINPRFEPSYWGLEYCLGLFRKKCVMPTAALPLLAALTPAGHHVRIVDENVEPLDMELIRRADIVGVTGMSVQRTRMTELLNDLSTFDCYVVVGGPWITVREDDFEGLYHTRFVGEAEQTWPVFLEDWAAGRAAKSYQQPGRTDLTTLPPPLLNELRVSRYMFGSLQFTRGCPFMCEFCDIIVTFGRTPRAKTPAQVVRELEGLRKAGFRVAFIVDDNLIGNRKLLIPILDAVIAWQREHGYPMAFFTEASLNLAECDDLMAKMSEANIQVVFVGVESPDTDSLRETKKLQNINNKRSELERIHHIQKSGLEVWAGMIVGFDNDDKGIFQRQLRFLSDAKISHAMFGMLSAIPKTPLYIRLQDERRLDEGGVARYGTNVVPAGMSREQLRSGYVETMSALYRPDNFFDRVDALFLDKSFVFDRGRREYWATHRARALLTKLTELTLGTLLVGRLMTSSNSDGLRRLYLARLWTLWRTRRDPSVFLVYAMKCATFNHYALFTQDLRNGEKALVNTY